MKKVYILPFMVSMVISFSQRANEITPYKFTDAMREKLHTVQYAIPPSSRFTAPRQESGAPDVIYYLSKPRESAYPIVIFCEGSSHQDTACSVIHMHRYCLQEVLDLGAGLITVEQWGIDGNSVDRELFMEHYTRSQRLYDHRAVIDHLKQHPPIGWNGKLIFIGASEGGPLVTTLTTDYADITAATVNWCGAGDWSWREELWAFVGNLQNNASLGWRAYLFKVIPRWMYWAIGLPRTREDYDRQMDETLAHPIASKKFVGMTYKYHADALLYPSYDYVRIRTPFLVVVGAQDSIIDSADAFVEKAQAAGAPITYMRLTDMDHFIRRRPEIIEQSFQWLKEQIS